MPTFTEEEIKKQVQALYARSADYKAGLLKPAIWYFEINATFTAIFADYRAYLAEKAEEMKNQYAPYPAIHSETDSMEKGGRQVLEDFSTKYLK